MSGTRKIPHIDESEVTPLVSELLNIIREQAREIDKLKDEIAKLKGIKPKPNIKASNLDKNTEEKGPTNGKRPGSAKRSKKLEIDEEVVILPKEIPVGAKFKGYAEFIVQDIEIRTHNTRYKLARYETPDGTYVTGELPPEIEGHFGAKLRSLILYQHHHCHVTQPLLKEQLREWGIDISAGQLNAILTEGHESFHQEKREILETGLRISSYVNVDDTGARHQGKNGVCTHIGNDLFAWFESTSSKSRTNFLALLCAGKVGYFINDISLKYIRGGYGLFKASEALEKNGFEKLFETENEWQELLDRCGVKGVEARKAITEGAILGFLTHTGIKSDLVILSDDAPQFDVFLHALCWVHAERHVHRLIPNNDLERAAVQKKRDEIWDFYRMLREYRLSPDPQKVSELDDKFDQIFKEAKTCCKALNEVLGRTLKNKKELLRVLKRPEIPLHNNASETDIREYAKRRKIQGGTRSNEGRASRDTFTSLKKTCRKMKVSFWCYLNDRVSHRNQIPRLPVLMSEKAKNSAPLAMPPRVGTWNQVAAASTY